MYQVGLQLLIQLLIAELALQKQKLSRLILITFLLLLDLGEGVVDPHLQVFKPRLLLNFDLSS